MAQIAEETVLYDEKDESPSPETPMEERYLFLDDLLLHNPSSQAAQRLCESKPFKNMIRSWFKSTFGDVEGEKQVCDTATLTTLFATPSFNNLLQKETWRTEAGTSSSPPNRLPVEWISSFMVSRTTELNLPPEQEMLNELHILHHDDVTSLEVSILLASWLYLNEFQSFMDFISIQEAAEAEEPTLSTTDTSEGSFVLVEADVIEIDSLPTGDLTLYEVIWKHPVEAVAAQVVALPAFQYLFSYLFRDSKLDEFKARLPPHSLDTIHAFGAHAKAKALIQSGTWIQVLGIQTMVPPPYIQLAWLEMTQKLLPSRVSEEEMMRALGILMERKGDYSLRDKDLLWSSYFFLFQNQVFMNLVVAELKHPSEGDLQQLVEYKVQAALLVPKQAGGVLRKTSNPLPQPHESRQTQQYGAQWVHGTRAMTQANTMLREDYYVQTSTQPTPLVPSKGTDFTPSFTKTPELLLARPLAFETNLLSSKVVLPRALVNAKGTLVFEDVDPVQFKTLVDDMRKDGVSPEHEMLYMTVGDSTFQEACARAHIEISPSHRAYRYKYIQLEQDEEDSVTHLHTVFEYFQPAEYAQLEEACRAELVAGESLTEFVHVCTEDDPAFKLQSQRWASLGTLVDKMNRVSSSTQTPLELFMEVDPERPYRCLFVTPELASLLHYDEFEQSSVRPYGTLFKVPNDAARLPYAGLEHESELPDTIFENVDPACFNSLLNQLKTTVPASALRSDWFGKLTQEEYMAMQVSVHVPPPMPEEEEPRLEKASTKEGIALRYLMTSSSSSSTEPEVIYDLSNPIRFAPSFAQSPLPQIELVTTTAELEQRIPRTPANKRFWTMYDGGLNTNRYVESDIAERDRAFLQWTVTHMMTLTYGFFHTSDSPYQRYKEAWQATGVPLFPNELYTKLCFASLLLPTTTAERDSLEEQFQIVTRAYRPSRQPTFAKTATPAQVAQLLACLKNPPVQVKAGPTVIGYTNALGERKTYTFDGTSLCVRYEKLWIFTGLDGQDNFQCVFLQTNVAEPHVNSLYEYFNEVQYLEKVWQQTIRAEPALRSSAFSTDSSTNLCSLFIRVTGDNFTSMFEKQTREQFHTQLYLLGFDVDPVQHQTAWDRAMSVLQTSLSSSKLTSSSAPPSFSQEISANPRHTLILDSPLKPSSTLYETPKKLLPPTQQWFATSDGRVQSASTVNIHPERTWTSSSSSSSSTLHRRAPHDLLKAWSSNKLPVLASLFKLNMQVGVPVTLRENQQDLSNDISLVYSPTLMEARTQSQQYAEQVETPSKLAITPVHMVVAHPTPLSFSASSFHENVLQQMIQRGSPFGAKSTSSLPPSTQKFSPFSYRQKAAVGGAQRSLLSSFGGSPPVHLETDPFVEPVTPSNSFILYPKSPGTPFSLAPLSPLEAEAQQEASNILNEISEPINPVLETPIILSPPRPRPTLVSPGSSKTKPNSSKPVPASPVPAVVETQQETSELSIPLQSTLKSPATPSPQRVRPKLISAAAYKMKPSPSKPVPASPLPSSAPLPVVPEEVAPPPRPNLFTTLLNTLTPSTPVRPSPVPPAQEEEEEEVKVIPPPNVKKPKRVIVPTTSPQVSSGLPPPSLPSVAEDIRPATTAPIRMTLDEFRSKNLSTPADRTTVQVRPSTIANAGLGVFALRDIKKGEPITEYYGQILTYKDAKLLKEKSHVRSLYNMRYVINGLNHINGTPIEAKELDEAPFGVGAFLNDARDASKTNVDFDWYDMDPSINFHPNPAHKLVFIKAIRDIQAGEELFVNYGIDYWKAAALSAPRSSASKVTPVAQPEKETQSLGRGKRLKVAKKFDDEE